MLRIAGSAVARQWQTRRPARRSRDLPENSERSYSEVALGATSSLCATSGDSSPSRGLSIGSAMIVDAAPISGSSSGAMRSAVIRQNGKGNNQRTVAHGSNSFHG